VFIQNHYKLRRIQMNLSVLTRYLMTAAVSGAGLTCAVALVCPPSLAQQASMSGASTVSTPLGYVSSVSLEVVLPNAMYFPGDASGAYVVTPSYSTPITSMSQTVFASSLSLNGGTAIPTSPAYSFEAAAANALNLAVGVSGALGSAATALWEPAAGIIKSGAGVDGF
jgi:hypothetical protein